MKKQKHFDTLYPTTKAYQRYNPQTLTSNEENKVLDKSNYGYKTEDGKRRRIEKGHSGFSLLDYAFRDAGYTGTMYAGETEGRNKGYYSWKPLGLTKKPDGVPKWQGTPERASQIITKAAKFYGAADVGFCELDERWLFSHTESGKKIVFEDIEEAYETEDKAVIPKSHRYVIVLLVSMDIESYQYAPTAMVAAGGLAYSRMHILAGTVAEFIRGLGYQAIPSGNDMGANVPIAIQAGLGHTGRTSRLIHWKYGPLVKICKVFTDLPVEYSPLAPPGIIEFCEVCSKCQKKCPSNCIPAGPRSFEGAQGENTGVLKWHNNEYACANYWDKVGTSCSICFRVCAFTKPNTLFHRVIKWFIKYLPQLNRLWVWGDDLFGYGKKGNPDKYWDKP